jgi:RND superfamily putative drug exporter
MILIGERQWRLPALLDALLPKLSIEADLSSFDQPQPLPSPSRPQADPRRDAPLGWTRPSAIVTGLLLVAVVVTVTVAHGTIEAATATIVAVLLGALVAALTAADTPTPAARLLGLGAGIGARGVGLAIGVAAGALAASVAENQLPPLPSAAGVTIILALALAVAPALISRGRIPLIATGAATVAFWVGWTADPAVESAAATALLWSTAGFSLSLAGRLLGNGTQTATSALARRHARRHEPVDQDPAGLGNLLDDTTELPPVGPPRPTAAEATVTAGLPTIGRDRS